MDSGFTFPLARLTVNLAPADVRKEGPAFDIPIALGILCATSQPQPEALDDYVVGGELGLDGDIRATSGALPMVIGARAAGKTRLLVPEANAPEAVVVEGLGSEGVTRWPFTGIGQSVAAPLHGAWFARSQALPGPADGCG